MQSERLLWLKNWVRSDGLKKFTIDDLKNSKKIDFNEVGIHIEITDAFLSNLDKHYCTPPLINVQKRKFYVDVQHGLGNRLRAYGSAAAIAKATDRQLVVVWVPDNHCECRMSDLFDYEDEVIEVYDQLPDGIHKYNYMEIEKGAVKDQPIVFSDNQDVLVRSAYTLNHPASDWESECKEIQQLKPSQYVMELVRSVRLPGDCIGVHVRMEAGKGLDHNSYDSIENWSVESHKEIHHWREKSHYSVFFKKIDSLLKDDVSLKFFLATDLRDNYDAFVNSYGSRILLLNRPVFDRSKLQIVYAMADAILLSKCTSLLGSTWSSFSELAMRLSRTINNIEMSGVDF